MPGKPGQGFDIEGGSARTAPWRTQWLVSSRSESERSIVSIAKVRNPVAVVAGRHYSLNKASASLNDRYAPPFGQALTATSGRTGLHSIAVVAMAHASQGQYAGE